MQVYFRRLKITPSISGFRFQLKIDRRANSYGDHSSVRALCVAGLFDEKRRFTVGKKSR